MQQNCQKYTRRSAGTQKHPTNLRTTAHPAQTPPPSEDDGTPSLHLCLLQFVSQPALVIHRSGNPTLPRSCTANGTQAEAEARREHVGGGGHTHILTEDSALMPCKHAQRRSLWNLWKKREHPGGKMEESTQVKRLADDGQQRDAELRGRSGNPGCGNRGTWEEKPPGRSGQLWRSCSCFSHEGLKARARVKYPREGSDGEGWPCNNNCLVAQHQQGINFHNLAMSSSLKQFIAGDLLLQFVQTSRKRRSPNLVCERKHH